MKKALIFGFAFACVCVSGTMAQTYNTAIGVRVDDGFNITGKQSLGGKYMLEGILHTPILSKDVGATLLFEKHQKLLGRNFSFNFGAGPHMYWRNSGLRADGEVTNKVMGLSLLGGLDLCIGRLNIGVDVLPEIHLTGEPTRAIDINGAAISVRYIVDKKERKKLKDRINWPKRKDQKRSKSRRK